MKWLVLVHILSAILGVGPVFFSHVLLGPRQSANELRHSIRLFKTLELFPKIGGSLAVLTGLALVFIGDYGRFMQLWIFGSLVLYILIQIIVIGFVAPAAKQLSTWLNDPSNRKADALPPEQQAFWMRANKLFWMASTLGTLLFAFMIMKPVIGG
ncbi:DUF2269 family protein [Cohnella nanjingensis]|uniref:DUF2269 family protein n=1 Tax=Cohnella nanjingensis TaxID=1387779 RepID=A0A7X0RXC5_9BACL|nr:DUF2269 family protein [Cohnella nanjingensis]MBB6674100.1 DUF2269 family protein [Cohnella nanjingensis]